MSTPYHVRLAISQYGDHFRTELFTEDLGDTEGDVIPELPSSISEWLPYLAQGAELPPDSARQLGKDLFSVLLGQPENAKKWSEVLSQAGRTKRSVRLLIDATGESVRDLPYGLLCEPHDDWYLFREGRELSVAFVRILRRCSPRPLKLPKRMRILLAVAEPRSNDVASFDAPMRLQQLAESLRANADLFLCGPDGPVSYTELAEHFDLADALTLTEFTRTTRESLRRSLQQPFDGFHLLAHGHGAGVLLCNARGEPAETTASELGSWCSQSKAALAFLQVCKASQTASRGGFGGVAQQLLNPRGGNLSAVIASTFPLDAEHSTRAAIAFYDRLSAGKSPEDALAFRSAETDWCWAFLELWARPGALSGTQSRSSFQFVSPYRGLSSFAEQDADLFFGRKAEVAELLRIIRSEPAVAVVGDSGSGKSSLLQAGIASAVHRNGLGGIDKWRVVTLRPGYSPAQALFVALTGTNSELSAESSRSALTSDDQPLLLIMDQFEEIFTLARDKVEVQMLCNAILEAIERRGDKFRVIIGMRSEFLGQAASVPGLSRLIRRPWVLRPPGVSDLRATVSGPAEHCGYTFQGPIEDGNPNHRIGLLDRILADPLLKSDGESATSAPLPLLQFALERLWLKAVDKGVTEFTHAEFDELGGMGMAIAQHAEAVFLASGNATGLKTEAHGLAEQIICSLVSTRMTRQPRLRESLQEETGNAEAARRIVDYLVGERLLTVRVDPEDLSSSMIDLSHEAIIENWARLRDWLAEDRQGRALREEFRKAAEQWEFGFLGVPPRSWFALPAVDIARRYLVWIEDTGPNLTATQSQFVDALRRMRTRVTRRRRIIMGSLSMLTVASMLLGIIAWRKAGEATTNGAAMTLAGGIRLCDEDRPRMDLLNIAKSLDRCPTSATELRKDILYNLTVWTPKFMHLELACDL